MLSGTSPGLSSQPRSLANDHPQSRARNPIVNIFPDTPCLECGVASIVHTDIAGHGMAFFSPRWAVPQLGVLGCVSCGEAPAKQPSDRCGFCLSAYWAERPTLLQRHIEAGTSVFL